MGASADTDEGVEGLKAGELTRSFGLLIMKKYVRTCKKI